jgi:hypothetical protein
MSRYERESRLRQSWRSRKNENIWASTILILTLSSSRTLIRESEQRYSSLRKFKHYKSSTLTSRRLAFERKRTMRFLSFEKKEERTAKQETTEKRENILLDVASWNLSLNLMTTIKLVESDDDNKARRVWIETTISQRVWSWSKTTRTSARLILIEDDENLSASDLEIWDDENLSTSDLDRSKNETAINQLVELITVKSSTSDS